MSVTEIKQDNATPRIQCYSRIESKKLANLLEKVRQGAKIKKVTVFGSLVYIDLE